MRFVIEGIPTPQGRPRFSESKYFGKSARVYDPMKKQKEDARKLILREFQLKKHSIDEKIAKEANSFDSEAAFCVSLVFYLPLPSGSSEAHRNLKLWDIENHSQKPDLDNMEKFYLDCMTGIFFKDDCQVVRLSSKKMYSLYPKTVVTIMEINNKDLGEEAVAIFSLITPQQFEELVLVCHELCSTFNPELTEGHTSQDKDCLILARCAYILSHISENYSSLFSKIRKKYPEFCERAKKL